MNCEDCENYKPKQEKLSKELKKIIESCEEFCIGRRCRDCELNIMKLKNWRECPVYKTRQLDCDYFGGDC